MSSPKDVNSEGQNLNSPSFEEALQRLQQTVKQLEGGDLTLEQALQSFEEGVRLSRNCQEQLSAAEKKVEILTRVTAEGVEMTPFAGASGTAGTE